MISAYIGYKDLEQKQTMVKDKVKTLKEKLK